MTDADAQQDIVNERMRQDNKWGANRIHSFPLWLTVLQEEIGEASMACLERDDVGLRQELVQVAAVAQAMLESFDNGGCRRD